MKKIRIFIFSSTLLASSLLINAASTYIEKSTPIALTPLAQQMMRFEEKLTKKGQVLFKNGMPKEAIDQELEHLREKFQEKMFCEEFEKAQGTRLKQEKAEGRVRHSKRKEAALSLQNLKAEGTLTPRLQDELEYIEKHGLVYNPLVLEQNLQRRGIAPSIEEKNKKAMRKSASGWKQYLVDNHALTSELQQKLDLAILTGTVDNRKALKKQLQELRDAIESSKEKSRKDASILLKYLENENALTSWLKNTLEDIRETGIIQDTAALNDALESQYALIDERNDAKSMEKNRKNASEWLNYFKENNALTDELQQNLDRAILTGIINDADAFKKKVQELYVSIENSKTLNKNRATPTLPALDPKPTPAKSMPPRDEPVITDATLSNSTPAKKPETATRRQRIEHALGVGQARNKTTPTLPTVTSAPAGKQAPARSTPPVAAGTTLPILEPAAETHEQRLARAIEIGARYSNASYLSAPHSISTPRPTVYRPVTAPAKSMPPRTESAAASTKLPKLATTKSASSSSSSTSSRPPFFEQLEVDKRKAIANKYKIAD